MREKIKRYVPWINDGSFIGDVSKLLTGTIFAQALSILISPILTRVFPPESYGMYAVYTSITNVLVVVSCLRYELSINLPKSDRDASNLFFLCLTIVIGMSLSCMVVLLLVGDILLKLLKALPLLSIIWLIPFSVFLSGTFLALNQWNTRSARFMRLSVSSIIASLVSSACFLGFGLAGHTGSMWMILASIAGTFTSTAVLGMQIWRDDASVFKESISIRRMKDGAQRYKKFLLYGTWAALLNTISWQMPAFIFAGFFSSAVVGYYALSYKMIKLPMQFVGGSIAKVFYQRASKAKNNNELTVLVENVFESLVAIGLLPFLMLSIIGKDAFAIVFGQQWSEAGLYIQIMSLWAFFWFISSPMSTLYGILEKQGEGLLLQIVIFLTRLISLLAGAYFRNPRIAIILFSATGVLVYGYLNLSIMAKSGVKFIRSFKIIFKYFIIFFPMCALVLMLKYIQVHPLIIVLAGFLITACYIVFVSIKKIKLLGVAN